MDQSSLRAANEASAPRWAADTNRPTMWFDQVYERGRAMIETPAEADIRCWADDMFDAILDFRGQDRWLTESSAFRGTSEISENPVVLGSPAG
jgi:hypothetical protein